MWSVIVAYGANEDANEEQKNSFMRNYKWYSIAKQEIVIIGDLNGKVDNNNNGDYGNETTLSPNGWKIVELARNNLLVIATRRKVTEDQNGVWKQALYSKKKRCAY